MHSNLILTPQAALSHLFFHCCFKDGHVAESEIKTVSEKLVAIGLNKELNFTDEVIRYQAYKAEITDEDAFVETLINTIRPMYELALYSFCVELCLSDGTLQTAEEALLQRIAAALNLGEEEQRVCKQLMVQRRVAETEKVF